MAKSKDAMVVLDSDSDDVQNNSDNKFLLDDWDKWMANSILHLCAHDMCIYQIVIFNFYLKRITGLLINGNNSTYLSTYLSNMFFNFLLH